MNIKGQCGNHLYLRTLNDATDKDMGGPFSVPFDKRLIVRGN